MSLRENYLIFRNNLDVDSVLPYLLTDGLLTMTEHDKILNTPSYNRPDALLKLLPNKGPNFYHKFCVCIYKSGQMEVIKQIGFEIPDNLINEAPSNVQPTMPSSATPTTYHPQLTTPTRTPSANNPQQPTNTAPPTQPQAPPITTYPTIQSTANPLTSTATPIQSPPTTRIFVLYSKDALLQTTPTLEPNYRRSETDYLQEVYDLVQILDQFSLVPGKEGGAPIRAYKCIYDKSEEGYIQNFLLWSEQQLLQCDLILILMSPQMESVLSGKVPHLYMEQGQANSHSVINILSSNKIIIPVYLNMPKVPQWLPLSLQATPTYSLNIRALQEAVGHIESYEELSRRAYLVLDEGRPELKDFHDLIRKLRHEDQTPPPEVVIHIPPPSSNNRIPQKYIEMLIPKVQFVWVRLGLKLGIAFDDLELIRSQYPNNPKLCTRKMFEEWVDLPEATFDKLVTSIRQVDFGAVADKLEQMKLSD